jgi:drug/metabolite transporter (DMT)-like permease
MNATELREARPSSLPGAVLLMVAATALWGVSFVAPLVLNAYTPLAITFGRFFFYGLVSLALLLVRYRAQPLGLAGWARAAAYGLAGNILFSLLVSFGVQDTGAEVVIPIIGLLPICVSVAGGRALSAAAWRRLAVPLALVTLGLAMVLVVQRGGLVRDARLSWPGVAAAAATVVIWTAYALSNARFLRAHPSVSGAHWSCAIGVATFALALVLAAWQALATGAGVWRTAQTPAQSPALFAAVTLVLGVGGSWLATICFNRASSLLPMSLVGQLIVLETLFGIAYACLYRNTLPPAPQALGMALVLAGLWRAARTRFT